MTKNRSLFQALLLRIHYKTSLALISVFLGILAFSGFYFFGQNIVNEADEQQRIARIQMNEVRDSGTASDNQESITPTVSENSEDSDNPRIGGTGGSATPGTNIPATGTPTPTISGSTPTATPTASPTQAGQLNAAKFVLGDPNAEKSIIAYYDFECVFCAEFIKDVLPQLKTEYLDTGKAKIIFKNFPLSTHPTAPIAHNAALCASVTGSFWNYHDVLFSKQKEWGGKSENEVKALMKGYYKSINATDTGFDSCVDSNTYGSVIEKDKADGKLLGVNGTPTFLIGDEKIVGYQPIDSFRAILDAE
jgi:protein-disulfide isomerase